jgi:hypothetical protein
MLIGLKSRYKFENKHLFRNIFTIIDFKFFKQLYNNTYKEKVRHFSITSFENKKI